jgi:hypothetical protein
LEESSEECKEEMIVVKLDLLFRQLEVTVARCDGADENASFSLLEEARRVIRNTADSDTSDGRGVLSFHLLGYISALLSFTT